MKKAAQNRFRLQTLSSPAYISPVRDLVFRLAQIHGFSRDAAFDLKVACGEALSNIIRHACENDYHQPIFIEIFMEEELFEIKIRDFGLQKTIHKNLSRDLSEYRERGLGLYLIQNLTDYHHFDQSFDTGTELTLKKRLA